MTDHPTYAERANTAQRQATALRRLVQLAEQQPELAAVLADVDTFDMEQRLTPAALDAERASAEREAGFLTAWAEAERRVTEAGGSTYCRCGHTQHRHHGPLTEDLRLPCDDSNCSCMDLTIDREAAA
ncbi:hypothetical protein [Streptomyces sp. cg35]|uniref:hypothetical protein n=1 Tax=Streptomyces sp. cg35 TaxID=3421650 RepID=UPI003D17F7D7